MQQEGDTLAARARAAARGAGVGAPRVRRASHKQVLAAAVEAVEVLACRAGAGVLPRAAVRALGSRFADARRAGPVAAGGGARAARGRGIARVDRGAGDPAVAGEPKVTGAAGSGVFQVLGARGVGMADRLDRRRARPRGHA